VAGTKAVAEAIGAGPATTEEDTRATTAVVADTRAIRATREAGAEAEAGKVQITIKAVAMIRAQEEEGTRDTREDTRAEGEEAGATMAEDRTGSEEVVAGPTHTEGEAEVVAATKEATGDVSLRARSRMQLAGAVQHE
jgi:hypothetical protein